HRLRTRWQAMPCQPEASRQQGGPGLLSGQIDAPILHSYPYGAWAQLPGRSTARAPCSPASRPTIWLAALVTPRLASPTSWSNPAFLLDGRALTHVRAHICRPNGYDWALRR